MAKHETFKGYSPIDEVSSFAHVFYSSTTLKDSHNDEEHTEIRISINPITSLKVEISNKEGKPTVIDSPEDITLFITGNYERESFADLLIQLGEDLKKNFR